MQRCIHVGLNEDCEEWWLVWTMKSLRPFYEATIYEDEIFRCIYNLVRCVFLLRFDHNQRQKLRLRKWIFNVVHETVPLANCLRCAAAAALHVGMVPSMNTDWIWNWGWTDHCKKFACLARNFNASWLELVRWIRIRISLWLQMRLAFTRLTILISRP